MVESREETVGNTSHSQKLTLENCTGCKNDYQAIDYDSLLTSPSTDGLAVTAFYTVVYQATVNSVQKNNLNGLEPEGIAFVSFFYQ